MVTAKTDVQGVWGLWEREAGKYGNFLLQRLCLGCTSCQAR